MNIKINEFDPNLLNEMHSHGYDMSSAFWRKHRNLWIALIAPADTHDPYVLIDEARQARDVLSSKFAQGALAYKDECYHNDVGPLHPEAKLFCAQGAVMYVQKHLYAECNLIRMLNRTAQDNDYDSIIEANDDGGYEVVLSMFDITIRKLQLKIDLAESMAASYQPSTFEIPAVQVKEMV